MATDQGFDTSGLSVTSRQVMGIRDTVIEEWVRQVRHGVAGAKHVLYPILINTLPVFYENIAEALTPGHPRASATSNTDIATAHGNERARMTSYGPAQIIQEYQLFREAFADIANQQRIALTQAEWKVVHHSIDNAIRESVQEFTAMHDRFRQRIAAALSHDMRNPLSVIVSAAQLVALNPEANTTVGIAGRILDNSKRLNMMIEEMLDAMSFNRGQKLPLDLTRFDMYELASAVCADAGKQHPCVVTGYPVLGYWCENSMRRAIENLLSNAIKYGDGMGVSINVSDTHGRMLLSVHNGGNAIPREQSARIFHYLWRQGGKGDPGGWGIGLPFVQNVAEGHGGSVVVDSSPALGTTFLIDLPLDCRPFVSEQPLQAAPA